MREFNKLENYLYLLTEQMFPSEDSEIFPLNEYLTFFLPDSIIQFARVTKKGEDFIWIIASDTISVKPSKDFQYFLPFNSIKNFLLLASHHTEDNPHKIFKKKSKDKVFSEQDIEKLYDSFVKNITTCGILDIKALAMQLQLDYQLEEKTLNSNLNKLKL